ncbi:MAG: hypothetical protein IKS45_00210, partial [Thermoguttaceae bacterium]|nr:hypothetical protein [Thermoguttaceae bacterium]
MNRKVSETAVLPQNAAESTGEAQTSADSVVASSKAYEDVLSEKRSHWLFRIQFCLILSLLAHIALLAYIHDKFIILKVNLA